MKTLVTPKFNWGLFILTAICIRLFLIDMTGLAYLAILISLYQFGLLFDSIGHFIPVRYLLGSFMCVQFFVGPAFAYYGLQDYAYFMYQMQVPASEYFLYAIPSVCAFILGLHLFAGNLDGEVINQEGIKKFVQQNGKIPYIFIILGFFASVISNFFSSEFGFVFYLLGSFKFIGLFLLILGNKRLKPLPMVLVMGSIVSSSLGEGMFHDLLTWIIFTASIFAIKYKISFNTKVIGAFVFILLALSIQLLKGSFRKALGTGEQGSIETLANVYEEENSKKGIFNYESIASANTRINQGWIITNIMITVPDKEPYSNGKELMQLLEAAILPRILAPDKLRAGDPEILYKYSGVRVTTGTSMALGAIGDAYVNYGPWGGCIFMFVMGLVYSFILSLFKRFSKDYPVLILFTALSFYYPIRPDCELQTVWGHLIKSLFIIFVMIKVFEHQFKVRRATINIAKSSHYLPGSNLPGNPNAELKITRP
ncbi:MAG: hypothetical protein BGO53_00815 [Sphingobacteriales bacterium 39-19]|nr:hypothetical protein [Sphingobacteriales bacterium]OJW08913.1 MAG: hypothetical protein BGO53_00815 [Sphingobacteriales bacterium 39-19]